MATTYIDTAMGARAIGARTDNAATPVTDVSAEEDRYAQNFLTEGWAKPANSFQPVAGAGATMEVIIGSGAAKADYYAIAGNIAGQGVYLVRLAATTVTVTLNAADGSFARKDEIYLIVSDNAYDASGVALPRLAYRDGTPSGSPAAPGPDGVWDAYVLLATIDVPQSAADILACTITDQRLPATFVVGEDSLATLSADVDGHIGSTATTEHPEATPSVRGFLSATDKTKLNTVETGAQVNPTASALLASIKTVDGAGSGLDADLLDGSSSAAFAASSHGTHVSNNSVTHDYMQNLYRVDLATGGTNIGTGVYAMTCSSLVVPSASVVKIFWQIRVQKDNADLGGNTVTILPRNDGVNMDAGTAISQQEMDVVLKAVNDTWMYTGGAYTVFGGADTSVWSVYISKSGSGQFSIDGGFMIVEAIPV